MTTLSQVGDRSDLQDHLWINYWLKNIPTTKIKFRRQRQRNKSNSYQPLLWESLKVEIAFFIFHNFSGLHFALREILEYTQTQLWTRDSIFNIFRLIYCSYRALRYFRDRLNWDEVDRKHVINAATMYRLFGPESKFGWLAEYNRGRLQRWAAMKLSHSCLGRWTLFTPHNDHRLCAEGMKESEWGHADVGFSIFQFIFSTRLCSVLLFLCYLFTPRWLGIWKEQFTLLHPPSPQLRSRFMTLTWDFSFLRCSIELSKTRAVREHRFEHRSLHHTREWLFKLGWELDESNSLMDDVIASCNFLFNIHLIKRYWLRLRAVFYCWSLQYQQQTEHSRDTANNDENEKENWFFSICFACIEMKTR